MLNLEIFEPCIENMKKLHIFFQKFQLNNCILQHLQYKY